MTPPPFFWPKLPPFYPASSGLFWSTSSRSKDSSKRIRVSAWVLATGLPTRRWCYGVWRQPFRWREWSRLWRSCRSASSPCLQYAICAKIISARIWSCVCLNASRSRWWWHERRRRFRRRGWAWSFSYFMHSTCSYIQSVCVLSL